MQSYAAPSNSVNHIKRLGFSLAPLCEFHDGAVVDVTAVTQIELRQFGGGETFCQVLDARVTNPGAEKKTNTITHTVQLKRSLNLKLQTQQVHKLGTIRDVQVRQTLEVGHNSQAGIGQFGAVWYLKGAETSRA